MARYADRLTVRYDEPRRYELWSEKEIEVPSHGRNRMVRKKGVMFASVIIQKSYVGLYYSPIYTDPDIAPRIHDGLMKLLRGKSCFYVKRPVDDDLRRAVQRALADGFKLYRKKGWV